MKHQVWSTDNMKVEFFFYPKELVWPCRTRNDLMTAFLMQRWEDYASGPYTKNPWFSSFSLPDAWSAPDQIDKKKEKEESFAEVSITI